MMFQREQVIECIELILSMHNTPRFKLPYHEEWWVLDLLIVEHRARIWNDICILVDSGRALWFMLWIWLTMIISIDDNKYTESPIDRLSVHGRHNSNIIRNEFAYVFRWWSNYCCPLVVRPFATAIFFIHANILATASHRSPSVTSTQPASISFASSDFYKWLRSIWDRLGYVIS